MTRQVVMLDCETSGRYVHAGHEAWEVAYWNLTTGHRGEFFVHLGDIPAFLARSEPQALKIGRFLDRYPLDETAPSSADTERALFDMMHAVAPDVCAADERPIMTGSNPAFDAGFLAALTWRFDFDSTRWFHHHPIDLGSFAAGVLGITPGSRSLGAAAVAELCGLPPGDHSAGLDVTAQGRAFLLLDFVSRYVAEHGGRPADVLAEVSRAYKGEDIDEVFVGLDASGIVPYSNLGSINAGAGDPDPLKPSGRSSPRSLSAPSHREGSSPWIGGSSPER